MKNHLPKRILSLLLVVAMLAGFVPGVQAAPAAEAAPTISWTESDREVTLDRSDRLVQEHTETSPYQSTDIVRVSIILEEPSTLRAGFSTTDIARNDEAMAYNANLQKKQETMAQTISRSALNGKALDVVWNLTLAGNLISANVPYGKIEAIEQVAGVERVVLEQMYEPAEASVEETVAPQAYTSGSMTGALQVWSSGYTGAGTRIAIIDTGTDTSHQSFDNGAYLYALAENAAAKGMSVEDYKASLDLMTAEDIAAVLPELNVYELDSAVTAEQLYLNEKLAFGYNYVDANLNISHEIDYQGEHGSHVAGISAANRYIPRDTSYVEAAANVMMLGVAPDAQIITMKVFGEESPYDSDYMAAIEDAILLGCDVVNLSLGSTAPGSPYNDVYSELLEMMKQTDTVVAIASGNQSNWAETSMWGYLYNDDVSFDEVGSPGSYESAFTVASVDNDGTVGYYLEANGQKAFYIETLGYGNTAMTSLDTSLDLNGTDYGYVFLDSLGDEADYEGIDVTGKVVFVSRGTLAFTTKANNALSRGAIAVVVYNNQAGVSNMDLTGLLYEAPVVSITQAEGAAIRAASEAQTAANGTVYYTGTVRIPALMAAVSRGSEYYTMSDFSSWGVPESLTLKPEITAPGGQIYSVWGTNLVNGGGADKYETMSGTSMATPQISGMAALLAQYFEENGVTEATGMSARHLAQSLLMSTAQPLFEEESGGNYYSLLNQGAGLARVDLAAQAESYILVDGQDDGKVKAELGDDPERTGVYSFDFTITNMTGTEQAYALDADAFRQDVFEYQEGSDVWLLDTWTTGLEADVTFTADVPLTNAAEVDCDLNGDGVTDKKDADFLLEYLVGNETELKADGDVSGDGTVNSYDAHLLLAQLEAQTVTVPANGTVNVSVQLALTDAAKAELDAETPNGTYVQAFVYAKAVADAEGNVGVTHSIPMLAFYGNWSDPSMFDRGTLIEHIYLAYNKGPYLYYTVGPYGNALGIDYGDGSEYYYGGNPVVDDAAYLPERNAFSSTNGSRMTEQTFTLIRSAGDARMQITNAETGEVYFEKTLGELYPAYYNSSYGAWENTIQYASLNWTGTDAEGQPLAEGTKVDISLTAASHYYRQADGSYPFDELGAGSTMTTSLTIDNTAPEALDIDISQIDSDKLTVKAQDNEYVAAVVLLNGAGTKALAVQTPNQTVKNAEVSVDLDLTDIYGKSFMVAVYDYAYNSTVYEVEMDLGSPLRSYFTAIDNSTMNYVSMDLECNTNIIADSGLPMQVRAAEYVGGYVFIITTDNSLCVANDEDLSYTQRIAQIDPTGQWLITGFNDLAYNRSDGKLYGQFYSELNYEEAPYLCTIDMSDGSMEVIAPLSVDVNTMAIDGMGNFYSAAYGSPSLYTYTLDDVQMGRMTYIGEMSYYGCSSVSSMAWDHNANKLYWAYPNTLLEINTETAEPTLLGYHTELLVGLYIRPAESEGRFDPVDQVDRIELSHTETRVLKGASLTLEATVWPWYASDRSVTWTSSDESVATVSASGAVTGVELGTCTITATSNLDPSISASCTIEVFQMEKTLNALVWDENGEIWMSEFNTADIPAYTKLSSKDVGKDLAAATVGQDGNLYAASLNPNTMKSELYTLDPETYEPTLIGASTDGYVDLAPAPGQPGNSLMAVFGGNVMQVDATTGDYYNWYYMFSYNLVGLAYVGTQEYKEWGYDTMVDWYFIIDRVGYVYLLGFLEQDGSYYYLEHDALAPGGIYTQLNFEMDTPYFGSAYFDGQFLYYSAYKQSRDNVTLMAIDVAGGSKACYRLGTFADGVWPVAGLMELGELGGDINIVLGDQAETMAAPTPVTEKLSAVRIDAEPKASTTAKGTLNSVGADVQPLSSSDAKDGKVYVNVTMPENGTNGRMTVSYDPEILTLVDAEGVTEAFAWTDHNGTVELAFAEADTLWADETVARLTFTAVGTGDTTVAITTTELNDAQVQLTEELKLTVEQAKPQNPFTDVKEGAFYYDAVLWAVENGITNGVTKTLFNPNGDLERGQVVTFLWRAAGCPEPTITDHPFVDVRDGAYYYKAMLWAVENGITTGIDPTHFAPNEVATRAQALTFLWRALDKPACTSSENPFTDVREGAFYYNAVLWAVENGIAKGMTQNSFGINVNCSRGHMVTFLYRAYN